MTKGKFYISVDEYENKIYHRFKDNGETTYNVHKTYEFDMYIKSNKGFDKSVFNETLQRYCFDTPYDLRNFINENKFSAYGMGNAVSQFLCKEYLEDIIFDMDVVKVMYFDIENEVGDSFTTPDKAEYPINAITVLINNQDPVCFTTLNNDSKYSIMCHDEKDILEKFVQYLYDNNPDILCGFNSKGYDIVYMANRMDLICGVEFKHKMSPLYDFVNDPNKLVYLKKNYDTGEDTYQITGLPHLDFLDLFKKYGNTSLPDNKLNTIAEYMLGRGKKDNPYKAMKDFYEKAPSLFIDYNIEDVVLIRDLNDKLMLIDLAIVVAMFSRVNIQDVFAVTRVWDNYIYYLLNQSYQQIPPKKQNKRSNYGGGYVKEPHTGKHKNVVSFDLTSEYPMLILQYGISPETIVSEPSSNIEKTAEDMIRLHSNNVVEKAHSMGYSMAANGTMYRKDIEGVIPRCIEHVFNMRVQYKNQMKDAKNERERILVELNRRGLTV